MTLFTGGRVVFSNGQYLHFATQLQGICRTFAASNRKTYRIMIAWIESYWDALVVMTAEMAPYLLLGFLIAGLLRVFVPKSAWSKHLAPKNMKSVVKAAAIGVPLPLCSCGVIPTSVGLRKEGASHGACASFLIATPQTGVDSIAATYSLMGLPFAIVRPVAALFTAMFGGWMVNRFAGEAGLMETDARRKSDGHEGHEGEEYDHEHGGGCCHHHDDEKGGGCCHEHNHEEGDGCWHGHGHEGCGCGHSHHHHEGGEGWGAKLHEALEYAFVEMMQDVGKWLIVGLLIAALITVAVPNEWLAALHEYKLLNMLIVLAVAIPMYVCATGSIPIAVSLMAKGLTPGAALVLLMAGPAVNSASMLVIGKVFGRRTLTFYLLSIVIGAVAFGLGIDYLLPQEWFSVQAGFAEAGEHCAHSLSVMDWVWIAALVLLLLNAFWQMHRGHTCECHQTHGSEHAHHSHHLHDTSSYRISGMSCNHCKANVERAIKGVEGVENVTVDLASGMAKVTGEHDSTALIERVKSYGYEASLEK